MLLLLPQDPFPHILGDVNGDGQVTITDVAAVIKHVMDGSTGYFREAAANVIRDNAITISDITTLVEMILGKKAE